MPNTAAALAPVDFNVPQPRRLSAVGRYARALGGAGLDYVDARDALDEAIWGNGLFPCDTPAQERAWKRVQANTDRAFLDAAHAAADERELRECRERLRAYRATDGWRSEEARAEAEVRARNQASAIFDALPEGEGVDDFAAAINAAEPLLADECHELASELLGRFTRRPRVQRAPVNSANPFDEVRYTPTKADHDRHRRAVRLATVDGERVAKDEATAPQPDAAPQPGADGPRQTPDEILGEAITRLRESGTPEALRLVSAVNRARTEAPSASRDEPDMISAADLMAMTFPPIKWVVPGYIPEGLTFLCGAPKIGKSWMALGLALEVASGGKAFGEIKCQPGPVLYLALEDNRRRLQSRLQHMGVTAAPAALSLTTTWPTVDEDCVGKLEAWIDANPDARMIVVDVFAKIKSAKGGNKPQYDVDYKDVTSLQRVAINRGVAIILVHHTRKMESDDPFDAVSGTRGLTGSADSTFVLTRASGQAKPALYGRGRDIEEIERAMEFDGATGRWSIAGPVVELASSPERQAILDLLRKTGEPMQLADIAERLQKSRANVTQMLAKLIENGTVRKAGTGWYELARPVGEVSRPWSAASSA